MPDHGQPPQLGLARIRLEIPWPELLLIVVDPLCIALIQRVQVAHHVLELQLRDERGQADPNRVADLARRRQRELLGVHLCAWEPLALDLDVGMLVLEFRDECVVPVTLLARVALNPVVIADDDALASGGRLGGRLWRTRRRRGLCRSGGRSRGHSTAAARGEDRRTRNRTEHQRSAL